MSIGLDISGSYPVSGFLSKGPSPSEWLASFKEWLDAREGEELVSSQLVEGPDGEVLLAQVHPFSEELQVACPRLGEVRLTVSTGSCGPGYHEHVADLAHAMASELKVKWRDAAEGEGDDSGYFASGDRAALEDAMREHVAELAAELPESATVPPNLLLSPTAPSFVHPLAVSTPLGPRDAAWLKDAREGHARALDAMPWRTRGRGAEYHRARALALAWCEARWRKPFNDAEEGVLREVARCLEAAHAAGAANLPWREWSEIRGLLEIADGEDGAPDDLAGRAAAASGPLVGYRRGEVVVRLPADFTMRLPGSFSEEMDEDGTWHGTDGVRTVYASAGRLPPVADMPGDAVRALQRAPPQGEPHVFRGTRVVGMAGLRQDEDEGEKVWVLACGAAEGSYMLRATILFPSEADRDWAIETFRSIDRGLPEDLAGATRAMAPVL